MINTLNINFIRPLKLGRSGREQIVVSVGARAQRKPANQLPLERAALPLAHRTNVKMSYLQIILF